MVGSTRRTGAPRGGTQQTASPRSQRHLILARKTKRRSLYAWIRGCLCWETAGPPAEAGMEDGDADPPPPVGGGRGEGSRGTLMDTSTSVPAHPPWPDPRLTVNPVEVWGCWDGKGRWLWGSRRAAHLDPSPPLATTLSARAGPCGSQKPEV